MARAVSAQERKISRLEAKNAEQDLKIDQLREKIPTRGDSVLLITGGYIRGRQTASTEVFPSCSSPPPLPSTRYYHQTFKTSDPTPLIASCGGETGGERLASCLVLDLENQRWDESRMGSLTTPRSGGAVVELNQGVLFLGGFGSAAEKTSDFLETGSIQWQQGPRLPQEMFSFCAVPVTESSFITIYDDKIHEFDAAIAGPTSEEGWRDSTLWPTLETWRGDTPGCEKIGNKVIQPCDNKQRGRRDYICNCGWIIIIIHKPRLSRGMGGGELHLESSRQPGHSKESLWCCHSSKRHHLSELKSYMCMIYSHIV